MANEFEIDLGNSATGWTVYVVVFSNDWHGSEQSLNSNVWNGTAFVADSYANRNAGAILLAEVGTTGNFVGDSPAGITAGGDYPIIGFRRLGGSPDSQNDTVLTLGGSSASIPDAIVPPPPLPLPPLGVLLAYEPSAPISDDLQRMTLFRGSGIPFYLDPPEPITLTASEWEFRIGSRRTSVMLRFNTTLANLSISASGRIAVNPTAAQTSSLPLDEAIFGELWRILPGDDYQEVRARVRIEVRTSVR